MATDTDAMALLACRAALRRNLSTTMAEFAADGAARGRSLPADVRWPQRPQGRIVESLSRDSCTSHFTRVPSRFQKTMIARERMKPVEEERRVTAGTHLGLAGAIS
jgi:hypothetical protein